jgi:uncharacterized protein YprB with RNaseH-like and TPR domain
MLDESLRRRLAALNRSPLPPPTLRTGEAATAAGESGTPLGPPDTKFGTIPLSRSANPTRTPLTQTPGKSLPGLLRRGTVLETDHGPHLQVRIPLAEVWPRGEDLSAARLQYLKGLISATDSAAESTPALTVEFANLAAALPDRAVAIDLETCGLAGAALFLIGVLRHIGNRPTIELLVARNYAEEPAVLATFWKTVAKCDVLISFNGKSFDWPMLCERSARYRMPTVGWAPPTTVGTASGSATSLGQTKTHVDILHHARRRWRRHLPDCRLQTLERFVCGRQRSGDIPGQQIPTVYAEYVRTGFEREMDFVLHHNALDLVTLYDLALRMAA